MTEVIVARNVVPSAKPVKRLITRVALYFLGTAFQTACVIDPDVKREVSSWPDGLSFLLHVEPAGPDMAVKKTGGRLLYLGNKNHPDADLRLCMKNIEFAFMMMTSLNSTPEVVWQNRQYVKGDLNMMMSVIRCLDVVQTILFPNFLARRYIKKVPPLTLRKIANRIIYYTAGIFGFIK